LHEGSAFFLGLVKKQIPRFARDDIKLLFSAASMNEGIFQFLIVRVSPEGFSTTAGWFRISLYFGRSINFSSCESISNMWGKCKFLLTLSRGNGLLSPSAFLQATQ
jgi:hypothetical protein